MIHGKVKKLTKHCETKEIDESRGYSQGNLHPGCRGIISAYEKKLAKNIKKDAKYVNKNGKKKKSKMPRGLEKNYNNCMATGTPHGK